MSVSAGQFQLLRLVAGLLILRIVASVFLSYRDYMPPNFQSDFLQGREAYFFGSYQWAFEAHVISGPCSLLLGMLLLSRTLRIRRPALHRLLGRVQVLCVLGLVVPSGFRMALSTGSGVIADAGFAVLALAAGVTVAVGWRCAVRRRFAIHQRWMNRCFALLCSAVVLRVIGGLATAAGFEGEWLYPAAAWACWALPLAGYEFAVAARRGSVLR